MSFNNALEIKKAFTQKSKSSNSSTFTIYSPPSLMKILNELTSSDVSSIHINESIYEKELFEKKQALLDWLVSIGADQNLKKKQNMTF